MFEITKENSGSGNYMGFGINENVRITSIAREPMSTKEGADQSKLVTAIHYEGKNGETFRQTIWDIDEQRVRANADSFPKTHKFPRTFKVNGTEYKAEKDSPVTPDQAVQMAYADYQKMIFNIVSCYVENPEIKAADYNQLVAVVWGLIEPHKNTPMRLMLQKRNGYLEVPKYGKFLEPMSVNPTKLDTSKLVNDAPAAEANANHPADAVTVEDGKGLPF